jgi:hypothetical protein
MDHTNCLQVAIKTLQIQRLIEPPLCSKTHFKEQNVSVYDRYVLEYGVTVRTCQLPGRIVSISSENVNICIFVLL